MPTIRIVLDRKLLAAANGAARRLKVSRVALLREALRRHLKHLDTLDREARDREGYRRHRQAPGEFTAWDGLAADRTTV